MANSILIRTDITRNPPTSITDYHVIVHAEDQTNNPSTPFVVEFEVADGADLEDPALIQAAIDDAVALTAFPPINYGL